MAGEEDLQQAISNIHSSLIERNEMIISSLVKGGNGAQHWDLWLEYVHQLDRLVPSYATPHWLKAAVERFGDHFRGTALESSALANFAVSNAPSIGVPILVGEAATLDFEQLFTEQSAKFQLDQVFEGLVSRLAQLIEADVIDNRIIHDSLTRLNALFRRTKKGSFATVMLTMNFGRFFLNSFSGVLKANKYARPIVESFEEEFAQASETVQKAEEGTKKDMISKLVNPVRMDLFLEANPELRDTVGEYLPAAPQVVENEDQSDTN